MTLHQIGAEKIVSLLVFVGVEEIVIHFIFVSRLLFVFFYAFGDRNTMEQPPLMKGILILGLLKSLEMHLKLPNMMESNQFIPMINTHADLRCKVSLAMKLIEWQQKLYMFDRMTIRSKY